MTNAKIPWTITYDEILYIVSGVLRVHIGSKVLEAGPGDSIWLPAGTELIYECESCLMAYAIHPIGAAPSPAKRASHLGPWSSSRETSPPPTPLGSSRAARPRTRASRPCSAPSAGRSWAS